MRFVAIDPHAGYAHAISTACLLPNAVVVVDHFHLVKLANDVVTKVRRRVTWEQMGRRGRKLSTRPGPTGAGCCRPANASHPRGSPRCGTAAPMIEELIEDEHKSIALSPELRDNIEELVLEDFDALHARSQTEQRELEKQRVKLTAQRQKLLDAHYAGAIPLDLLKTEQDRIASQLTRIQQSLEEANANYEQARATLAETLDLTRDCYTAYLNANESTRRLFNQAFFSRIYIDEDDETRERTVRVDYNQPFDDLLTRIVPAGVHHQLQAERRQEKQTARQEKLAGGEASQDGFAQGQGCPPSTLVGCSQKAVGAGYGM